MGHVPKRAGIGGALLGSLLLVGGFALAGTVRARDAGAADDPAGIEFFETKIRPVLAERCYTCHGAKAKKVRGGLRLDTREAILQGGDSGPALVPGQPDKSLLIKAIRYDDPNLQMPPKRRLSAQEVADFETWVKRGAPLPRTRTADKPAADKKHWAFQAPKAPPLPEVRHKEWVQNPIDRFILARLEAKGLTPAEPADKRTLLRRVTYDLIGLPPTPEEMDAFLADQSSDAFAKVVDRLLASPRYGERWGRHWLDLVRYTDDFDETWRYRDWVVKAFNDDLPYDRFIVNQIAGDRLPPPSPPTPLPRFGGEGRKRPPSPPSGGRGVGSEGAFFPPSPPSGGRGVGGEGRGINADGIVATTLLSIGPWGGIDRKKRMADIVDDQVDTVGRSFLGLTLACARCHDHKFDPLSSADYYGLAGIFYSSRVISDTVYLAHQTPRLRIPLVPPAEVEKHRRHMARVHEMEKKLEREVEERYAAFARGLLPQTAQYLLAAWEYQNRPADQASVSTEEWAKKRKLRPFALAQWIDYLGGGRLGELHLLDRPVRDYDGEAGVHVWGASAERPWWGVNSTEHEVPIETWLLPPRSVSMNPGVEGGSAAWKSPFAGRVRIAGRLTDADPHDGSGVAWVVDQSGAGGKRELSSGTLPNGGSKALAEGRTPDRLASVAVKPGDVISLGMWLASGDAHYDITNVEFTITRLDGPGEWNLTRDVMDNLLEGNPHRDSQGNAGVWAFYNLAGSNRKQRMPAVDAALEAWHQAVAAVAAGKLDRKGLEKAAQEFQRAVEKGGPDGPLAWDLTGIRSPFWVNQRDDAKYLSAEARDALAKRATEVEQLKNSAPPLPCAHGAQEGGVRFSLFPGFQDVRIHVRGSYERLGKRVPRHFPKALAGDDQPPIRSGSGRLELARWIASADNPLTARVMVNRIWQHHFGEGIVRTPSNFGKLGTPPSHPELLDYLATQFVSPSPPTPLPRSGREGRSSAPSPPGGGEGRVRGWSIKAMHRMILLSAAYRQSSKVRPESQRLDPNNLLFGRMNRRRLEAEALRDGLLSVCGCLDLRAGGPADGDAQSTRRMLYLRNSRSKHSGFGAIFDAADASIQVEKRTVSTVAPQALFLMNNPLIAEKVGHLIQRPEIAGQKKTEERIGALYRLLFNRRATAEEMAVGRRFIESMADQPAPKKSGDAAPLGPWEAYAQALLLSNEFLFVD